MNEDFKRRKAEPADENDNQNLGGADVLSNRGDQDEELNEEENIEAAAGEETEDEEQDEDSAA